MEEMLRKYLGKLEGMLDLKWQAETRSAIKKIFNFEPVAELPFIDLRGVEEVADKDWPSYPYNDAFFDPAKMLLNELGIVFRHVQVRDYHSLNIRGNYGTVILPSIFGAIYQLTETSLPWASHFDSREDIKKLIAKGLPDYKNGLGKTCFETATYYSETLKAYPKLKKAISIYHPDLQSTFDAAHLIWGHDILYAMYDCPGLVHELLSLITETYIVFMKKWKLHTGEGNDYSTHWNYYIKGGIMLRDDSSVMISPAQYVEFVKPYDQRLLNEFGGCIHFCGKGDAFIRSMCESKNLSGINTSQPHLNNMEQMVKLCFEKKIALLSLPEKYIPKNAVTGFIVAR